jgi:hypothetical protein
MYVVGFGQVAARARVLVHEVLNRDVKAVVRGGARRASQVLDRGVQADARGAAQVFYRRLKIWRFLKSLSIALHSPDC